MIGHAWYMEIGKRCTGVSGSEKGPKRVRKGSKKGPKRVQKGSKKGPLK